MSEELGLRVVTGLERVIFLYMLENLLKMPKPMSKKIKLDAVIIFLKENMIPTLTVFSAG